MSMQNLNVCVMQQNSRPTSVNLENKRRVSNVHRRYNRCLASNQSNTMPYGVTRDTLATNTMLDNDNMSFRIRYLTYGTSAQLRQEYGKVIPWSTQTEFRLRRKFRKLKRRARKLGTNIWCKSFGKIQNMKNFLSNGGGGFRHRFRKNFDHYQSSPAIVHSNLPASCSSSLTSLLDLIEEANKNLINSFTKDNSAPPKCPPRIKRTMSTYSVLNTKQTNDIRTEFEPKLQLATDNYKIAFIEKQTRNGEQNNSDLIGLNDIDTISVKSLDSYFCLPVANAATSNHPGDCKKNSKILTVRSHFQINDGTVYLEDSDWEMCSEMSQCSTDGDNEDEDKQDGDGDNLVDIALSGAISDWQPITFLGSGLEMKSLTQSVHLEQPNMELEDTSQTNEEDPELIDVNKSDSLANFNIFNETIPEIFNETRSISDEESNSKLNDQLDGQQVSGQIHTTVSKDNENENNESKILKMKPIVPPKPIFPSKVNPFLEHKPNKIESNQLEQTKSDYIANEIKINDKFVNEDSIKQSVPDKKNESQCSIENETSKQLKDKNEDCKLNRSTTSIRRNPTQTNYRKRNKAPPPPKKELDKPGPEFSQDNSISLVKTDSTPVRSVERAESVQNLVTSLTNPDSFQKPIQCLTSTKTQNSVQSLEKLDSSKDKTESWTKVDFPKNQSATKSKSLKEKILRNSKAAEIPIDKELVKKNTTGKEWRKTNSKQIATNGKRLLNLFRLNRKNKQHSGLSNEIECLMERYLSNDKMINGNGGDVLMDSLLKCVDKSIDNNNGQVESGFIQSILDNVNGNETTSTSIDEVVMIDSLIEQLLEQTSLSTQDRILLSPLMSNNNQTKNVDMFHSKHILLLILYLNYNQQQQLNEIKQIRKSCHLEPEANKTSDLLLLFQMMQTMFETNKNQKFSENETKMNDDSNQSKQTAFDAKQETDNSANVVCNSENRFVNKIVLNNSINQFNINMPTERDNGSVVPVSVPSPPQIVNVITDNSVNKAMTVFDIDTNQTSTKMEPKTDEKSCEKVKVDVNPEPDSGDQGKHRTVLQIKSSPQSRFNLFHSLRNQLERKRNKAIVERLKRKQLDEFQSMVMDSAGGEEKVTVTLGNTSKLEIKPNGPVYGTEDVNTQGKAANGTLKRLLGGSRGGTTRPRIKSTENSEVERDDVVVISHPYPIGYEFGTFLPGNDRQGGNGNERVNSMSARTSPVVRCLSERNFRTALRPNRMVDGRLRMMKSRQASSTSTSAPLAGGIYNPAFNSQLELNNLVVPTVNNRKWQNGGHIGGRQPVVTFTLPRNFKSKLTTDKVHGRRHYRMEQFYKKYDGSDTEGENDNNNERMIDEGKEEELEDNGVPGDNLRLSRCRLNRRYWTQQDNFDYF